MEAQAQAQVDNSASPVAEPQGSGNDWDDAKETFLDETVEQDLGQQGEELIAEGSDDSQLEAEIPDYLKLDELKAPRKYKGEIQKWIQDRVVKAIEEKYKGDIESSGKQAGEFKQAAAGLLEVLTDIAKNPERGAYYIEKYGPELGLDPALARSFIREKAQEAQREHDLPIALQSIDEIAGKYMERMISEQDPRVYMAYQAQMLNEVVQSTQKAILGQVGHALKKYHETYVEPDKRALKESQERAEKEQESAFTRASSSNWDKALVDLKSKYPEIDRHKKGIKDILLKQKTFRAALDALNQDPSDIEGRLELIESAFMRIQKMEESKKKPKAAGLPPSKHTVTAKKGGSDWDEIRSEFWSDE